MPQIRIEEQTDGVILRLNGRFIGGEETDKLRETLKNIAESNNNKLVLDFEKVAYLNSTAIGTLISANSSFVKKNGKIVLACVNKQIENIFKLTKLTMVFPMAESVENAKEILTK